eukprot:scaffold111946_cov30-Tisochrysis_lutea.AAC.3
MERALCVAPLPPCRHPRRAGRSGRDQRRATEASSSSTRKTDQVKDRSPARVFQHQRHQKWKWGPLLGTHASAESQDRYDPLTRTPCLRGVRACAIALRDEWAKSHPAATELKGALDRRPCLCRF